MPVISLPNDHSATIYSQEDLSERASRTIELAYLEALQTSAKISRMGIDFDETTSVDDPDIESKLEDLYSKMSVPDVAKMRAYEATLIVQMVKTWTVLFDIAEGKPILPTDENVLDIPRAIFTKLAAECAAEFNKATDEVDDKGEPLPKVEPGNSAG